MRYFIVTLQDYTTAIACEHFIQDSSGISFYKGEGHQIEWTVIGMFSASYWQSVHEIDEAAFNEAITEESEGVH